MKESTVILTSLYSQIYSPSHRQKERVEERKKESTTMSVSVNQKKKKEKLHWYNGSLSGTCGIRWEQKKKKRFWSERDGVFRLAGAQRLFINKLIAVPAETNKLLLVSAGSCWMGREKNNPSASLRRRQKWEPPACTWEFDGCGWSARDNAGRRHRRRSARVRNMHELLWQKEGEEEAKSKRRIQQMKDGGFKAKRLHKAVTGQGGRGASAVTSTSSV